MPVLDRCANWFAARVVDRWDGLGDHDAFLLEPVAGGRGRREFTFHRAKRVDPGHEA